MMSIESRVAKLEQAHGTPAGCERCAKFGNHFDALKEGRTEADILAEIEAESLQEPHVVEASARKMTCQQCGRPFVLVIQTVDNWRADGEREGLNFTFKIGDADISGAEVHDVIEA